MSGPEDTRPAGRARSAWRDVDGILLLDKPVGLSSNEALQRVRRLLRAAKAGHTGSLDPLASGLLPLCFGQATKVSGLLLEADKRYRVAACLGERTTTGDAEGAVVERQSVPPIDAALVARAFAGFLGMIAQVPPMYSALKHEGQRLYALARKGVDVNREPRAVTIRSLDFVALDAGRLEFDVSCSKGTYVRTLVEDLARALGTCAHVVALRRTELGPFSGRPMYPLEQVEAAAKAGDETLLALLLPPDAAVQAWPAVRLGDVETACLLQGQAVFVAGPSGSRVRMYGPSGRFLGVGEMTSEGRRLAPLRIMVDVATAAAAPALA